MADDDIRFNHDRWREHVAKLSAEWRPRPWYHKAAGAIIAWTFFGILLLAVFIPLHFLSGGSANDDSVWCENEYGRGVDGKC